MSRNKIYNTFIYNDYTNLADFKEFYKNLPNLDFNDITNERINELKNSDAYKILSDFIYNTRITITSKNFILPKNLNINSNLSEKYLKLINVIKTNPRTGAKNSKEKYILFALIIDPNFDALIIYGSNDNINTIKSKMSKRFGIFDNNLVKIERKIINKVLNKEEIDNLNEKIDSIVYK